MVIVTSLNWLMMGDCGSGAATQLAMDQNVDMSKHLEQDIKHGTTNCL